MMDLNAEIERDSDGCGYADREHTQPRGLRIALAGKMGAGKTTAAKVLGDEYGFVRLSLAEPLYELARLANQVGNLRSVIAIIGRLREHSADMLNALSGYADLCDEYRGELAEWHSRMGANGPEFCPKPRKFLQALEQDVLDAAGTECLLMDLENRVSDALLVRPRVPIVCDGVRRGTEADGLDAGGWVLVSCECPEAVRLSRVGRCYGAVTPAELDHASETELDGWDDWGYRLDCSGSVEEEAAAVRRMVDELRWRDRVPCGGCG